METKSLHLLQEHHCPGACKRELYEGLDCQPNTCEYNIHDPFNGDYKRALQANKTWLPAKPAIAVKTVMRVSMPRRR